jgi:uncharacterized protein YdgA (DUF945 family)
MQKQMMVERVLLSLKSQLQALFLQAFQQRAERQPLALQATLQPEPLLFQELFGPQLHYRPWMEPTDPLIASAQTGPSIALVQNYH